MRQCLWKWGIFVVWWSIQSLTQCKSMLLTCLVYVVGIDWWCMQLAHAVATATVDYRKAQTGPIDGVLLRFIQDCLAPWVPRTLPIAFGRKWHESTFKNKGSSIKFTSCTAYDTKKSAVFAKLLLQLFTFADADRRRTHFQNHETYKIGINVFKLSRFISRNKTPLT